MPSTINAKNTSTGVVITPDASGQLELQTADTTRMTIDVNGNVGIGTATPTAKLHVSGSTGALNRAIQITPSSEAATIDSVRTFALQRSANDTQLAIGYATTPDVWVISSSYGTTGAYKPLAFATSDTERMRIDSSGNVLVNNTSTVYGKVCSQAGSFDPTTSSWATNGAGLSTFGGYGGGLVMIDGSAGYALWVQDNGKDFYIRGNVIGSALTGGVYINDRATSWSAASDENVKDIIEPITNGLEKISTLRTVIGKYKDEAEGKRHPFLIAQDVQAVLPEAVSIMNKDTDNECLGLSYTDVIPLLVKAIQELKAELDTVKAELATLKGEPS